MMVAVVRGEQVFRSVGEHAQHITCGPWCIVTNALRSHGTKKVDWAAAVRHVDLGAALRASVDRNPRRLSLRGGFEGGDNA